MRKPKLICVAGARPHFMKVAPLLRLLQRDRSFATVLAPTGQHYDAAWEEMRLHPKSGRIPPLWDAAAAERCLAVFRNYFGAAGEERAFAPVPLLEPIHAGTPP